MDDYRYSKLLHDPAAFSPKGKLYSIEIWKYADSTETEFRAIEFKESDVDKWLEQEGDFTPLKTDNGESGTDELRVLLSPFEPESPRIEPLSKEISAQSLLPLSMSRKSFEEVAKKLKFSGAFLQSLSNRVALSFRIPHIEGVEEFVIQSCWTQASTFSMVVMYHAQKRVTTVMVQGLRGDEISLLSSCLKSSLEESRQGLLLPLLLPAILIENKAYSTIEYADMCYRKIWDIEGATKIHAQAIHKEFLSGNETQKNGGERLSDGILYIDFEDITRGITSVSSELARYEYACQSSLPLLNFLDQMANQHISTAQVDEHIKQLFLAKNARLRSFYNGLSARLKYLLQRADAQRQTVYSLTAQKDNLLNHRMLQASKQDSADMRAMAEDSKIMTLATLQDSAEMRTIAAVTIFFLPGTATATFFSTNFFNFLAPEGERVVSGWIWLYFLFITVFTIATSVLYFTLSQRNKQKIAKQHKADAELPPETSNVITIDDKKSNSEIQMVAVGTDTRVAACTEQGSLK